MWPAGYGLSGAGVECAEILSKPLPCLIMSLILASSTGRQIADEKRALWRRPEFVARQIHLGLSFLQHLLGFYGQPNLLSHGFMDTSIVSPGVKWSGPLCDQLTFIQCRIEKSVELCIWSPVCSYDMKHTDSVIKIIIVITIIII